MAADLPVIIGEEKFLRFCDEATWATMPGSPTWVDMPVSDFNMRFKPKRRNAQARIGLYQRKYGANVSGHPSGNLVTPLYGFGGSPSLAQKMMEWGFLDQEVRHPRSKIIQWICAGHDDDKTFLGCRVNSATLAGSEAGIVLTLDLIGQSVSNAAVYGVSAPNDRKKCIEFLFEDSTLTLGGTPVKYSQFQWGVQKNLDVIYQNSKKPTSMPKQSFMETFSVTPLKSDATWDALRDALGMTEVAGVLTLVGDDGAGATVILTVTFGRLSLIDVDEQGGIGHLNQPLTFDVLKPDGLTNGSVMAWTTGVWS